MELYLATQSSYYCSYFTHSGMNKHIEQFLLKLLYGDDVDEGLGQIYVCKQIKMDECYLNCNTKIYFAMKNNKFNIFCSLICYLAPIIVLNHN